MYYVAIATVIFLLVIFYFHLFPREDMMLLRESSPGIFIDVNQIKLRNGMIFLFKSPKQPKIM